LNARLALDPMVDYGEMNGLDPSILKKPCHLVLSKLASWQNFATKKRWFAILLNNKKFLMYILCVIIFFAYM
jgi:hypothetical protein